MKIFLLGLLPKIKQFVVEHYMQFIHLLLIICIGIAGYFAYLHFTTKPVTVESQQQAETPEGVTNAANNAHVNISQGQAKEAATQIRYITEHEIQPVYITQTTGDKVEETAKQETKRNGADFSIITDPKNPNEKYDLSKLSKNDTVTLNQYNIKAYKKVLHSVEYSPQEKVVGASVQWKINNSGTYVGVGIDHDIDDNNTYVKVIVTW